MKNLGVALIVSFLAISFSNLGYAEEESAGSVSATGIVEKTDGVAVENAIPQTENQPTQITDSREQSVQSPLSDESKVVLSNSDVNKNVETENPKDKTLPTTVNNENKNNDTGAAWLYILLAVYIFILWGLYIKKDKEGSGKITKIAFYFFAAPIYILIYSVKLAIANSGGNSEGYSSGSSKRPNVIFADPNIVVGSMREKSGGCWEIKYGPRSHPTESIFTISPNSRGSNVGGGCTIIWN